MDGEEKPIEEINKKLKVGQLVLVDIFHVGDAQGCHGFGGRSIPQLDIDSYLAIISTQKDGQAIKNISREEGLTLYTEKFVSLNSNGGSYLYVSENGLRFLEKIKVIEFENKKNNDYRESDLYYKRQRAEMDLGGRYHMRSEFPESSVGNTLGVTIYVGDSSVLHDMVKKIHLSDARKIYATLGIEAPKEVDDEIKVGLTDSVKKVYRIFTFIEPLPEFNYEGRKFMEEMKDIIKKLRTDEVTKHIKEVELFPGVTMKVGPFLDAIENKYAIKEPDKSKMRSV